MGSRAKGINIIATIVVISAIIVIGVIIALVRNVTDDALEDATLSEMATAGSQLELILEGNLAAGGRSLDALADSIVEYDISSEDIVEYFDSQALSDEFITLYYIEPDGNGISDENKRYDFSDVEAFNQALENGFYITEPHVSPEMDDVVFGFFASVVKNNETIAVLYGETSTDNFFEILDQSTNGAGELFILDRNINVLYSTDATYANSNSIPKEDVEEMGVENIMTAQNNFINEQNGGFYYDYFGVEKIMVYYPIHATNWGFAINVEIDKLNVELINAINVTNTINDVVYWLIITFAIILSVSQYNSSKALEKTAYYDALTGLMNMPKLKHDMKHVLEHNTDKLYSVLKFDVENFKIINEIFGFDVGDRVLKVPKVVIDTVSAQGVKVLGARSGVDECVVFAQSDFLSDIESMTKFYESFYKEHIPELGNYAVSFKYGRYNIEKGETDVSMIVDKVTLAHNMAKSKKGMTVYDYDENYKNKLMYDAEITAKMQSALKNKEFCVYLQPKFSVNESTLVGAEALVRWIEKDGNIIFPNDFIPLFEKNGFIASLDQYVLEETCKVIKKWMDNGIGSLTVSVNLSRVNLRNPTIVEDIVEIADRHCVPHGNIEIELTESASVNQESALDALYVKLQQNGFKTSIDDFGAGYSSLGMLKNLNINTLKMDRSFFVGGRNERRDDMLVDGIIKLSHSLGMYVVAEGIETRDQIELLHSMNCDAVQGYVHAKPMPIDEFEERYSKIFPKESTENQNVLRNVQHINDAKYASSFAPCGIVIAHQDEHFTIVEANDGYFNIIGFTRDELKSLYHNRGALLLHPEDLTELSKYVAEKIQKAPDDQLIFAARTLTKERGYIMSQMVGKLTINEMGQPRLYFSLMDISQYSDSMKMLKTEMDFNARIASLTNNVFFDYNIKNDTLHFSKNFADKFNIPNIITEFTKSDIARDMFSDFYMKHMHDKEKREPIPRKSTGEFCLSLPNGDPIWYLYSYETVQDDNGRLYTVGKMTEAAGHKAELDILKVKSETDPHKSVFNKQATDRYIRNYLRIATEGNDNGAFFVVALDNFSSVVDVFGQVYANKCLGDIGNLLRGAFRSADLIGSSENFKFYVFINDYKTIEIVKKKAEELCDMLNIKYEKDDVSIKISAKIGISIYPDDGDTFDTLYSKANAAVNRLNSDKAVYAVYDGELHSTIGESKPQ